MSTKPDFGKIEFQLTTEAVAHSSGQRLESPFRLVLLGDFSGRSNRDILQPILPRPVRRVDFDNVAEVFSSFRAELRLAAQWVPAETITLRFASLDDFHPDQLLHQIRPLAALLEKRQQLFDPAMAAAAVAELRGCLGLAADPPTVPDPLPSSAPTSSPPGGESDAETLARLLGGATPTPPPPKPALPAQGPDISQFIQNLIAPDIRPEPSAEQTAVLSALDLELTHQLRHIIHHPEFQALESAWRGLDLLVRQFGASENVQIGVIDLSAEELAADVRSADDLANVILFKLLRSDAGTEPWALILGNYSFRPTMKDIETLGRLGKLAAALKAPFVAGAVPDFVGCASFGKHPDPDDWSNPISGEVRMSWQALREREEASYLGLAMPRFLLRQPYGQDSASVESFPFEELRGIPLAAAHEFYLWGNAALLCGCVIIDAFQEEGWQMDPTGSGEVGDIPVHRLVEEGEKKVKPCAEAWLGERGEERIETQGIMPLLSIKGRDAVRVASLRSLASPATALSGRWG